MFSLNSLNKWIKRAGFSYKRMKTYVKERNSEEQIMARFIFSVDYA